MTSTVCTDASAVSMSSIASDGRSSVDTSTSLLPTSLLPTSPSAAAQITRTPVADRAVTVRRPGAAGGAVVGVAVVVGVGGSSVADPDGVAVGSGSAGDVAVGSAVASSVGSGVDPAVGASVGIVLGSSLGAGSALGALVGTSVGDSVGAAVGSAVGESLGASVGAAVASSDWALGDWASVGWLPGAAVGMSVGRSGVGAAAVGWSVGAPSVGGPEGDGSLLGRASGVAGSVGSASCTALPGSIVGSGIGEAGAVPIPLLPLSVGVIASPSANATWVDASSAAIATAVTTAVFAALLIRPPRARPPDS